LRNLAINQLSCSFTPFSDFQLQRRVFGGTNSLSLRPVVVHTRLAIPWTVNGVSLAMLNLVFLLQTNHLPPYKRVIIRICICCHELPPPVYSSAERVQVLYTYRRKERKPVI